MAHLPRLSQRVVVLLLLTLCPPRPASSAWIPDGTPICAAAGNQVLAALAPDGAGGCYVAWEHPDPLLSEWEYEAYDSLVVQRLTANGEVAPGWPARGFLMPSQGFRLRDVRLAADGAGVFVAWVADVRPSSSSRNERLHLQRLAGDGTFAAGWSSEALIVSQSFMDESLDYGWVTGCLDLELDGLGGCLVTFGMLGAGFDPHQGPPLSEIAARGVSGSRVLSSAVPLESCPAYGAAPHVSSLPDGAGGVLGLVNSPCRTGWVFVHSNAGGASVVPLGPRGDWHPRDLVADGAGGVFAVLGRGGEDARVMRLDASGVPVPGWNADGVGIAIQDGMKAIATSGDAMDVLVCWPRLLGQTGRATLQLVRVASDGTIPSPWSSGGIEVATDSQLLSWYGFDAASDGTGGLFIVWQDSRSTGDFDVYASHFHPDGSRDPSIPASGLPVCTAPTSQGVPRIVATGDGAAIVAWSDSRSGHSDVYAQRLPLDQAISTLASLVSAEARGDVVHLVWQLGAALDGAMLQRRTEATAWEDLATLAADGRGRVTYDDPVVESGVRVGYRLAFAGGDVAGETWVEIPRLALAVRGFVPNPAAGVPVVELSLAAAAPATLEILDVAGRRVVARALEGLTAGPHRIALDGAGSLPPGVYVVRLRQAGIVRSARGLVTP